jgi:hypothetical protein
MQKVKKKRAPGGGRKKKTELEKKVQTFNYRPMSHLLAIAGTQDIKAAKNYIQTLYDDLLNQRCKELGIIV